MPHPMLIAASLLLLTCAALAGELYTCKTPDGRTVITNVPCDGRAPYGTVTPTVPNTAPVPTPRPAVPSTPPAPRPRPEQAGAEACYRELSDLGPLIVNRRDAGVPLEKMRPMANTLISSRLADPLLAVMTQLYAQPWLMHQDARRLIAEACMEEYNPHAK